MKQRTQVVLILLCLAAGFALGLRWNTINQDLKPSTRQVLVYVARSNTVGERLVARVVSISADGDPLDGAVRALVNQPDGAFPLGTSVLSVTRSGSLVTVDFSSRLVEGFNGGSQREADLLGCLQMTVGQFAGIERITILVNGKPVDTIGGHFEIDGPIPVRPVMGAPQG